jgi:hypothetical protein
MSRTPNIFSPTTPDPNTPEGQALLEAREKFFGAIGKLIGTFAVLESALFASLGTLSQVPKPIALALFADQRVDGAMTAKVARYRSLPNRRNQQSQEPSYPSRNNGLRIR